MKNIRASLLIVGALLAGGCDVSPAVELERIGELLGSQPVVVVADIGAGEGDHLAGWSDFVGPAGSVFATEIDPVLVDRLEARVEAESLANVAVREATPTSTGLPESCCDLVVLRHVYHHLTNPDATLLDIADALKPGGRLLLIDFQPTWLLAPWTPDDLPDDRIGHGVTPEIIVREGGKAGFESVQVEEEWPGDRLLMDRFAVLLKKPAGGA